MKPDSTALPPLDIVLCAPRGFCAGVDRAIAIVEAALARYGAPVYVRHEIVHNRFVVEQLRSDGAIFVETLEEIPPAHSDRPVIFSAHGVATSVVDEARRRQIHYIDATCPLVVKVHRQVRRHVERGRHVLLIGHAGHPEIVGTLGQIDDARAITLIETAEDARRFAPGQPGQPLAWSSQTTLSVDDTAVIVDILKDRFPEICGPARDDICYATANRQMAVRRVAPAVDGMIVVGAENSSNSRRLREVAIAHGCANTQLLGRATEICRERFCNVRRLGITAGASAPEILVEEVIAHFAAERIVRITTARCVEEDIAFPLPAPLREPVTS